MPEVRDIFGELYSMTILHPGLNAVARANMRRSFADLSRSHWGARAFKKSRSTGG